MPKRKTWNNKKKKRARLLKKRVCLLCEREFKSIADRTLDQLCNRKEKQSMNALAAIIFIAFVGGGLAMNFIKDKEYADKNCPPPIVQVQSGDSVSDGSTADGK